MKKCHSLLRWPTLITGCAQQTFTVQNKPAAVAPRKPSPIISSFLELGRRKLSMQPKFGGAENVVKAKPSKHLFVNGFARFYYFGIILAEAPRAGNAHNNYAFIDMGNSIFSH